MQVGKTTLVKDLMEKVGQAFFYFIGDDIFTRNVWRKDQVSALIQSFGDKKLIILDEAQMVEEGAFPKSNASFHFGSPWLKEVNNLRYQKTGQFARFVVSGNWFARSFYQLHLLCIDQVSVHIQRIHIGSGCQLGCLY